jgi:hypothetical protein
MNLKEKILEAGKIMDHVAGRNHMGPFNGIAKVISVLRDQLAGKFVFADKITDEDVATLKSLQFTEEEIIALDKTRTENRNRIQAILARLIDDEHMNIVKANANVIAAFRQTADTPELMAEEMEFLKSENCRKVDMDYVMTNIRINALKYLLDTTSLNAVGAFKYIGKLDGRTTTSLGLELLNHQQAMRDYAFDISRRHLSASTLMENLINETNAGNTTLNAELITLINTQGFRDGIQQTLSSGELLKPKIKVLHISKTYQQTIPPLFNHWALCSSNNTYCLTANSFVEMRNSLTRALTSKNKYHDGHSSQSVATLLEKTSYAHQQKFPQSPIYNVHAVLLNISAEYNVSLSTSATMILDGLTRNITRQANNIQHLIGTTRMTYVYIGCEKKRMLAADKLVAAEIPSDVALRVVSTSSLASVDNTVGVLTHEISFRSIEGMFTMNFEAFTDDQLAALDYMRSLGVNDTSTALAFLQHSGDAILAKNHDLELSNYTTAMNYLDSCDKTLHQVIGDGQDLITKIAYDILLIPIATKFVACFDKLPEVTQLLISTGQAATELFIPEVTAETTWINNKTAGVALIGVGLLSLAAAGYLFFKRKPELSARTEKVYTSDEETDLISKHGKGR